ncbi:Asp23/Gls24 family envelope stress response protein [Heliorestis acidaminivorans]|uniref:Asp23/Gls24 family envelope stress response protein n=1 Tax=Heliorestis acidaminivorans TaxID=553427 RepID=A0A6I0EWL5_9FIRM|nr:Asp23/Gls24 family envelope stress response protein [Heliorestis acidaminivorans]KAB2952537.1 Asp23/Gls24 family envelope stress response protein [Heliorestis acidaminivorans]
MRIYAFVGSSGTGKSHRAIRLAHDMNCQVIIDDGLLIQGNKILAGVSAKKSATRIGAIKTALFNDEQHRLDAMKALKELAPQGILILGTSDGMVEKIARKLELPPIEQIVRIEDVASTKEIRKARYHRMQLGRHVVPAPAFEVKKKWSEGLVNPIKVFFRKRDNERKNWTEQSIVRPTFTSLGNLSIASPAVIDTIIHQTVAMEGVASVDKVDVDYNDGDVLIDISVSLYAGHPLHRLGKAIQDRVHYILDAGLGVSVTAVNVHIDNVVFAEEQK